MIASSESSAYKTGNLIGYYGTIIMVSLFLLTILFCVRYIGPDRPKKK